jgi:LacI family transcriptional regulator
MLSAATVERILETARTMGYVPNYTARALSTGRHANVALIVPDVANPFFPPLIRAAQMEAERSDFCVFIGNSDEDPRQEDRLVERFSGRVEGLILVSSRLPEERIRAYAAHLPVVLVNREITGLPRVLIDSASGVEEAVAHLAELGHRSLVYVSGPANSWSNRQRRAAVRKAATRLGLEVDVVSAQIPSHAAGRAAARELIASSVTAAIAFDDITAQGILAGFSEAGLRVPDDFSLIGCDDVLGAVTYPALTTVSNRSMEAGKAATALLIDMLSTSTARDVRYSLPTSLVIRATTAPPRPRLEKPAAER